MLVARNQHFYIDDGDEGTKHEVTHDCEAANLTELLFGRIHRNETH